jgi:hypothetical protein
VAPEIVTDAPFAYPCATGVVTVAVEPESVIEVIGCGACPWPP